MQAGQFSTPTRVKFNVDCKDPIAKKPLLWIPLLSTKISHKAGIKHFESFDTF